MTTTKIKYYVYILHCLDGSYYVGHTDNIDRRMNEHLAGTASQHTRVAGFKELVYFEPADTLRLALKREHQIKKWSRAKKESLICNDLEALKFLSKSH